MQQPIYTIQQLIIAKYGQEKFALGCEFVARWLNTCKQGYWCGNDILTMCTTADYQFKLLPIEAEELRKLFGLQSIEQLYSNYVPSAG